MNRAKGFTLVELLVVIAIITILAGIVVPRVTDAIGRARMARAASEIRGAELAIVKMLADVDKQGIDKFFNALPDGRAALPVCVESAMASDVSGEKIYSDIFYELLRRGKAADFAFTGPGEGNFIDPALTLVPTVARKLGSSYMDIPMDPWGTHPYFFFAGPLTTNRMYMDRNGENTPSPFRCYRLRDDGSDYVYNDDAKREADALMRGNPKPDGGPGYPSAKDLAVYIWSYGDDELNSQAEGGGDDVNNWDSAAGWSAFY
ncbi:MAG: type II secretion system protein [Candidatus Hydrogenedentes bacterium]|nr:type II secretion system protein [Candidatus Hydrogenedentota bacterium]